MADYYPLIARAVAGLEKNTGDARRVLYERARAALVAQLRGVSPALDESDVTRERLALEEAIRKVESEAAASRVSSRPAARRQPKCAHPIPRDGRRSAAGKNNLGLRLNLRRRFLRAGRQRHPRHLRS